MTPVIPMLKRDWIEFKKHALFTILFWVLMPILIHTLLAIPLSRLISMDIRYLNWSAAGVWISSTGMRAFIESATRLRKIRKQIETRVWTACQQIERVEVAPLEDPSGRSPELLRVFKQMLAI